MSFKSLIARLMQLARTQVFKLDKVAINEGIKFADKSVNQFETKISNKIGTPLPIDFSIEELFGNNLREVGGNVTDKIEARTKEKAKERAERREDREELERAREARHVAALEDINERYNSRLDEINKLTNTTVFKTKITFTPPPSTRIIGGIELQQQNESYTKEFFGKLSAKIVSGDYRELSTQGATEEDIELLINSRTSVTGGFTYASNRIKIEERLDKKGLEPQIIEQEANKLRKEAKSQYQGELEEENLLWEEEKEQYRQQEREARQQEREDREEAREKEKEEKRQARIKRREERPENKEAERQKRKEEREDREAARKKEREEREAARKEERDKKQKNRQQEREKKQQEREDQRELERELEQTRKDAIDEVKQLRAAGDITREQERDLIKQIREATKIEDVKEKKERKFDTSFLRDPVFVSSIYQSTYQFLPQQTKDELGEAVREYLPILENTVKFASILKSAIIATKGILTSLGKTGQTLNITGTAINVATNTITSLPIPTSVPPGVGLPLNVITQLSQNLDRLSDQAKKVEGAGELINETVPEINDKLDRTNDTLIIILDVVTILLDIIIFIDYIAKSGQSSLNDLRDQVGNDINNTLEESGNSSNEGENVNDQLDLLSRLNPNSTNPLFYKGFRLTLQYQLGEGELTQTRVLGVNPSNGVSLASDLSYTTSPEVLVQEIQFKIDNYDLIFINDPNIPVFDQIDNIDIDDVAVDVVIPEADLDLDIEIEGLPERLTKKEIRERKRKDRRNDRKERKEARQAGEITRREARKDRKNDRKERKQEAKERRKNKKRRRER
jgi:hypothetical protein